jgi:succinate dehydrogenase / fumarate reductase cytochrome b subunit
MKLFVSIITKVFMAATGILLVLFLFSHLGSNLLLFQEPSHYNTFAHFLANNPLLVPVEILLACAFAIHSWAALKVWLENRAARPVPYAVKKPSTGESTFSSRTMFWTGLVILAFLVIHIRQFKYGDQTGPNGLWGLVVRKFENPWVAGFYIFCMIWLGFHLAHAIGSSFQSLGWRNSSGHPRLRGASAGIGWAVAAGFLILPLVVFLLQPSPARGWNATDIQPKTAVLPPLSKGGQGGSLNAESGMRNAEHGTGGQDFGELSRAAASGTPISNTPVSGTLCISYPGH